MRILVTADTHAPSRQVPLWLWRLAGHADLILHAGDICDLATHRAFAAIAPLYAVRGNNDAPDLALPERLLLTVEGVSIGVTHGHLGRGRSTQEHALSLFPERPDVLAFGHSHLQVLEHVENTLLLNPGSPTKPRQSGPSAVWLTLRDGSAEVSVARPGTG